MDEKHTIDEVYRLVKENNQMLRAMRRDALVGGIVKFIWWVAILVVIPYLLFTFYLQPYLATIEAAYQELNQNVGTINSTASELEQLKKSIPDWQGLLKQFGGN